jgi:catechol 2,3-dioxygenase-like lactoylglutathione lyase family enzyme
LRQSYLSLTCADLSACRVFYAALGLAFVEEEHPGVALHLSAAFEGGVLELHHPRDAVELVGPGWASPWTTSRSPSPRSSTRAAPCSDRRRQARGACAPSSSIRTGGGSS